MHVRYNSVAQARHLHDDIAGVVRSQGIDAGGDTQGGKEHGDQWAVGGGLQDGELQGAGVRGERVGDADV